MKSGSDKFTFVKQTAAECFRSIATGIGQGLNMSEETGEARKTRVKARPGTIAIAPANEGFANSGYDDKRTWREN